MKKNIIKTIYSLSAILLFASPLFLYAASSESYELLEPINGQPKQTITTDKFPAYLQSIINLSIGATGAIAVLTLIIGGIQYIVSSVNETAKKDAKEKITNAVLGLLIILSAYILLIAIGGTDLIKLGLPTLKQLESKKPTPIDRGPNNDIGGGNLPVTQQ